MRELLGIIEADGNSIENARNGHLKVRNPRGAYLMTLPATPSDPRSVMNCWRDYRRNR